MATQKDKTSSRPTRPTKTTQVKPTAAKLARAQKIAHALAHHYPDAHCELNFTSPLQLLIATILSAQATDVSVNKATPALFAAFHSAADFAAATPEQIEPYVKTIGLFRSKAKAIQAACTTLVQRFGGEVPRTMEELLQLRGVARKTANVVLGNCFNINVGFVVDTHVDRLSKRLGLADAADNTANVERKLMALMPQDRWCDLSHQLIFHGRRACKARGVTCGQHPICAEFGQNCELRITAPKSAATPAKAKVPRQNTKAIR